MYEVRNRLTGIPSAGERAAEKVFRNAAMSSQGVCENYSFAPLGLADFPRSFPRLAPWAAFLRRFAAKPLEQYFLRGALTLGCVS